MCGITGIYNLKGKPVDAFLIQKMTDAIQHRGPDDMGTYAEGAVGLGYQRLAIIDVSSAGHQPMFNAKKDLAIVFNGEIYNFKELRKELENLGYRFSSHTDTEVVLNAYDAWGEQCLEKMNGMFAFAVYDKKAESLFMARDRLGEKPLYYYVDGEKFLFASEIKAILQDATIKREVDSQGIVNYFTFGHSIAPDTMYKGIKKLLPGHCLALKNGALTIKEYWKIAIDNSHDRGEAYYKKQIQELFEDSVRLRLVSDVPLGVFLSGGIDSSAIVAMMSKLQVNPIKTFSVGFAMPGQEFNELDDAKFVADHFKTEHHQIVLREADLVNTLQTLVYHFDEPFGDAANFPVFYMSQFAKKEVSVVLTGEGGDELFGGYRRYMVEKNRAKLLFLNTFFNNRQFSSIVKAIPKLRKTKKLMDALPITDDLSRHTQWLTFFSGEMRQELFKGSLLNADQDPLKMYRQYFKEYPEADPVSMMMYLDQKILLPDCYLEKVDKASMAVGLETRPPLLDWRLVELANSMPTGYKIKGFNGKCIFKEAMADLLPPRILRKKKHGFAVPTNAWFRGKLKDYLFEVLFDPKTKSRGYFNYDYIETLYRSYQQGNQPLDQHLWLLLNFELWHRRFIDTY